MNYIKICLGALVLQGVTAISGMNALKVWRERLATAGQTYKAQFASSFKTQKTFAEQQYRQVGIVKPKQSDIAAVMVNNFFRNKFNAFKLERGFGPSLTWFSIELYPAYKDFFIQKAVNNFGSLDKLILFKLLYQFPHEASRAFVGPILRNFLNVNPAVIESVIRNNPQARAQFIKKALELMAMDAQNYRLLHKSETMKVLREYADAAERKQLDAVLARK